MAERFSKAEWTRRSWVESANDPACGFPLQSLPYCVFAGEDGRARPGVGIGAFVLDLRRCKGAGLFEGLLAPIHAACEARTLNSLMACGAGAHAALRGRLMDLLDAGADQATRDAVGAALTPVEGATLLKPVESANYTDFYASIHHATRVGRLFRPENPLLPNYKYVPIGYHGRASSLVVSGTPVRRPRGQTKPDASGIPGFGPTRFLDYEVEVGMYIAGANPLGEPVPIQQRRGTDLWAFAGQRLVGARHAVLGVSAAWARSWPRASPPAFPPGWCPWRRSRRFAFRQHGAQRRTRSRSTICGTWPISPRARIDLALEAWLLTAAMRAAGLAPHRLSQGNLRDLYWTPAQLIAHHTSNGCNLLPGDLLATGTVSGPDDSTAGCLLELTAGGKQPLFLPNGEGRISLEDGDEVILRGFCRREGFPDSLAGGVPRAGCARTLDWTFDC